MTSTRDTTTTSRHRSTPDSAETEALREDIDQTRQHLADTVQQLSRQLNVPRRMKESVGHTVGQAGQKAKQTMSGAGAKAKAMPARAKSLPTHARNLTGRARNLPGVARGLPERARTLPGHARNLPGQARTLPEQAKNLPAQAKHLPEQARQHPRAAMAAGGAVGGMLALGVNAWITGRSK